MRRLRILQRLLLGGLGIIWAGLFLTQGVRGAYYRDRSERNRTRLIHLPAARGDILDRHGVPLAEDRLTFELAILPQELGDSDETWKRLGPLLRLSPEDLAWRYRSRFEARFSPVPIVRDLPRELAFRLEEERGRLPGVLVRPIPRRAYPLGESIGPVAGYLGLIAKEDLSRLQSYGYSFRDWVGKDGLEESYDFLLRGKDGGQVVEVNARGNPVQQLGFRPPERGRTIQVSIDSRLQEICHRLLSGGEGAILVMDSASGELLALASSPSADPNAFVQPGRDPEVRRILHDPGRPLFNRATRARVPPGSTFKAAVAYQALKEKVILPTSAFECPGAFHLGRSVFRCWQEQGHGPQRVTEALQHSCNVFFYNAGRRLGAERIAQAARLFRLDRPTGIDLPREEKGLVPDPGWMKQRRRQTWREGDTVSVAIGQGPLQVTPLEMLQLFNAIATEGRMPQPHLLLQEESFRRAERGEILSNEVRDLLLRSRRRFASDFSAAACPERSRRGLEMTD